MKFNSSTELAEYLGCSSSAISRWLSRGLPYSFDGFRYEYKLEDVVKWLMAQSPRHRRWIESKITNRSIKK